MTVEYKAYHTGGTVRHAVASFDWGRVKKMDHGNSIPGMLTLILSDGSTAAFPHSSIIRVDTPATED